MCNETHNNSEIAWLQMTLPRPFLLDTRLKTHDTDMSELEPKCKTLGACNAAAKAKMIVTPKPLTSKFEAENAVIETLLCPVH